MGKTMARSAVIYGEHKAVELKHYASQAHELESIINSNIGVEHHRDVNLSGARAQAALAEKDPLMRDAHVKVGAIDGDLIWRAKADKFNGDKEYDVVLVKHYSRYAEEHKEFIEGMFKEGSIHDQGGPLPRPAELEAHRPPPASQLDDFANTLAELTGMPGYFPNLDAKAAVAKLKGQPLNSWLVRAGSGGGVTWSVREKEDEPIQHYRILNAANYQKFKKFIEGAGHSLQITS